jgi:hypothetical protein
MEKWEGEHVKMMIFHHAKYFALHTIAHGMKKEMQIRPV